MMMAMGQKQIPDNGGKELLSGSQQAEPVHFASQNPTPSDIYLAQNTAMVDGQPIVLSPIQSNEFEQSPVQKPSKWRFFFVVLGIMQFVGVTAFIMILAGADRQAKAGASGTEFIGLLLLVTVVPAVGLVALINLVGLPIYMAKRKPHGKGLVFGILSLLISLPIFLFGMFIFYQIRVAMPNHQEEVSSQSKQRYAQDAQKFRAANAKPEITKEEAINLLKTCELKGFYYTNQTDKSDPANGGWGELSSTGIVLTTVDGRPYRISIADRLIPELVPIAREAQKTCGGPQFWHDGKYEQRQPDGTWK